MADDMCSSCNATFPRWRDQLIMTPTCDTACSTIRTAATELEVIEAVRCYLGGVDSTTLARIPGSLITLQMSHAHDIAAAAVEVARHEAMMPSDAPEADLVKEVATVLSTAAMRLAMLTLRTGAERA